MSSLKVVRLLQPNTTRIEQKLPERCLQFCIPKSSNKYWAFLATFHCPCSPLEMKCWRRYFFSDGRISDSSLAVGVWFWWWTCRTLSTLQSLCTATYWCFDTQGRDAQDVVSLYHLIYSKRSNLRRGLTSNDYWTCDCDLFWTMSWSSREALLLDSPAHTIFDDPLLCWDLSLIHESMTYDLIFSRHILRLEFRIEKASLVEDATSAKRSNRWIWEIIQIWEKKHITGLCKASFFKPTSFKNCPSFFFRYTQ